MWRRKRGIAVSELLENDCVRDRRARLSATAELGRDLRAGQPELPNAVEEVARNARTLVALPADGSHDFHRELAKHIAYLLLLFGHSE